MFCPNCGAQIPDGSTFCGSCGKALAAGAPSYTPVPVMPAGSLPKAPMVLTIIGSALSGIFILFWMIVFMAASSGPVNVGQLIIILFLMLLWGCGCVFGFMAVTKYKKPTLKICGGQLAIASIVSGLGFFLFFIDMVVTVAFETAGGGFGFFFFCAAMTAPLVVSWYLVKRQLPKKTY
jgi:hypothetical protein